MYRLQRRYWLQIERAIARYTPHWRWSSSRDICVELLPCLVPSSAPSMQGEIAIFSGTSFGAPSGRPTHGECMSVTSGIQPYARSTSRPKLEAFTKKTSHAPVLGLFGAFVNDWIPLIDEYYYCKSSLHLNDALLKCPGFEDTAP